MRTRLHPDEILTHPYLSNEQKVDLLHDLENELRELMVAEEENMPPATPPQVSLVEVARALEILGAGHDTYPVPTKHG